MELEEGLVSMVLTSEGDYKWGADSTWTLSSRCGGVEQVRAEEQKCVMELSLEKLCHRETFGKRVPFSGTRFSLSQ